MFISLFLISTIKEGLLKREDREAKENTTEELLALKVQFNLPNGTYATVALRQITGFDMGKTNMMVKTTCHLFIYLFRKWENKTKIMELPTLLKWIPSLMMNSMLPNLFRLDFVISITLNRCFLFFENFCWFVGQTKLFNLK